MGAHEARGMVVMVVMVMGPVFFLQILTAASRRRIHPPPQLFTRSCPVSEPRTLNMLALTLLLEAKRPRQVERVYGGHFCHLVREDGPEVRDVTGGKAQRIQLRELRVCRDPGQGGLETTERFAEDSHTRALPRVRCVPLLRLFACAHPIFVVTEVRARSSTRSTHCTTSSARHFLQFYAYFLCSDPL